LKKEIDFMFYYQLLAWKPSFSY